MARKAFTYSKAWKQAHMLNWLLYCTKGFQQILRGYAKPYSRGARPYGEVSPDVREMAQSFLTEVDRMVGHIELKIHEHASKAMEKRR